MPLQEHPRQCTHHTVYLLTILLIEEMLRRKERDTKNELQSVATAAGVQGSVTVLEYWNHNPTCTRAFCKPETNRCSGQSWDGVPCKPSAMCGCVFTCSHLKMYLTNLMPLFKQARKLHRIWPCANTIK